MKKILINFAFWLLDRLQERSTWLGLISFLVAAGMTIAPDLKEGIITAGVGLVGLITIITKDLRILPKTNPIEAEKSKENATQKQS